MELDKNAKMSPNSGPSTIQCPIQAAIYNLQYNQTTPFLQVDIIYLIIPAACLDRIMLLATVFTILFKHEFITI